MTLKRTVQYFYLRLVRIRREPAEIARGLAIGVFAGMSPFMGFHMLMALALAMLLKGNKFMALLGTWVGNPVTFSFILYLDFKVGKFLMGGGPAEWLPASRHPVDILHAGWNILLPVTLGSLVIGLLAAGVAYFVSNPLIRGVELLIRRQKARR